MDWFTFQKINCGYEFRRKSDGCITGKVGLFNLFIESEKDLLDLCNGIHREYTRHEKEWFKAGRYVGPREDAIKARAFKNCPEQNKRKKRFSNE